MVFKPQRVKRLGQEHADLSQSLPLSLSSSVFVRTHEDQMDWMQVTSVGRLTPRSTRSNRFCWSLCAVLGEGTSQQGLPSSLMARAGI